MGQDEEMGMSVESAMQLVRMMAAELGLVEYRVPLGRRSGEQKGKWGYLYLPKEFRVTDAERMSGWIRAMVMEEFEPVVDREERLAEALARQVPKGVIHAQPTAKSLGVTGCCGKKEGELGTGALMTTDPKVVTCNVKPED